MYSWGESAGAMSVGLHMVANGGNTEGLFHGAFMQVGNVILVQFTDEYGELICVRFDTVGITPPRGRYRRHEISGCL